MKTFKSPIFLTAIFMTAFLSMHADTITGTGWKGTAGNNNWSSTGNWDGAAPNTSGTGDRNLFFGQAYIAAGGIGSTTANNDLSGWHGYRITFQDINNNGATDDQSFTITGNGFTMFDFSATFPRIENDSFLTQTFTLTPGQTLGLGGQNGGQKAEIDPVNGNIVFSPGTTVNLQDTTQLQIFGNNGKTLAFNDVISSIGTNNSVAINGNSIVVFGAANTYGGDTFVNNGTLRLSANNAVNSATFVRLGDTSGTAGANLNLDGGLGLSAKINVRAGSSGAMVIANTAATSGNATYSGNVFLDTNVTVFANSGGAVTLSGGTLDLKNQTLTVDGPGSATLSGAITNSTGSGKLTKNGAGTLTIAGNNTNTGATTINAGAVNIQHGNALGSPAAGTTVANGAELQIQGGIITALEPLTLNGTGISSAGALHNISGANTFAGPITLGSASRINSDAGALTLNSATAIGGASFGLTLGGAGNVSVSSVINTTVSSVTKDGAGTLTLSGANTFTGGLNLNFGKVVIAGTSGSGAALGDATSKVTINGPVTLANNSVTSRTLNQPVDQVADLVIDDSGINTPGNLNFSGTAWTLKASKKISMNFVGGGTAGGIATITSVIGEDTPGRVLTKDGPSRLSLAGNNTWTGGFVHAGGTVFIAGTGSVFGSGTLTFSAAGAELASNSGTSRTVSVPVTLGADITLGDAANTGGLTFNTGAWTISGGTRSLTVLNSVTATITSIIGDGGSGFGLTKAGAGTLALNALNTYGGDTTINVGTINLNGTGTFGNGSGTLRLAGGNIFVTADRGVSANLIGNLINMSADCTISGAGTASGKNIVFSSSSFTGTGGTLSLDTTGAAATSFFVRFRGGGFTINRPVAINQTGGGLTELDLFNTTTDGDQTFSAVISGAGAIKRSATTAGTGANTIFSAANTYSGGTALNDGGIGLGIDSAGTPPTLASGPIGTGALTVSPGSGGLPTLFSSVGGHVLGNAINLANTTAPLIINGANTLTLSGLITGPGSLSKSGAAQLRLSPTGGNNSYSGGTTISGGEIALDSSSSGPADAPTVGPAGTGTISLGNGAKLSALSNPRTVGNHLLFTGASAALTGGRDLTLSGNADLGGNTVTLGVDNTGQTTLSGAISHGSLTKNLASSLVLSGVSTYTGDTTISQGTLALSGAGSINSSANIIVASGATFDVSAVTGGFYSLAGGQTLKGNGGINGNMVVTSGATVAPGASIGTLYFTNAPALNGAALMELNTTNSPATNDLLVLTSGTLTYGGTLTVTNTGPDLIGGETFTFFSASAYSGSFSATNLPALATGLNWYLGNLSVNGSIVVNRAPIASDKTYARAKSTSLKIAKSDLLIGASDPDGDAVSYDALAGTGSQGATVTEDANTIFYAPVNDNPDTLQYRLKDTRGGSVTKNIFINVTNAVGVVAITNNAGGSMTITFFGIPGFDYVIQRSPDLATWTDIVTNTAPSNGEIDYTETPPYSPAFYRTRQP